MKLIEMRTTATETLAYFMETMPEVPFTEDDIVFSFVKSSEIVERTKELCEKYCPEKIITESQYRHLSESIAANVLMGREKCVVIIRINTKLSKRDFRSMIIHELAHIFCLMSEIDGEHFIDIYGTGTMPDGDDKVYEGVMCAGYEVWSEFIAHYYSIKLNVENIEFAFSQIVNSVFGSLDYVTTDNIVESKGEFAYLSAYWLSCTDAEKTIRDLFNPETPDFLIPNDVPFSAEVKQALYNCLIHLWKQVKCEKPWKISETFIYDVGSKFNFLRIRNSQFLGIVNM